MLKKEELEQMSYKDITNLILTEKGLQTTDKIFHKIIDILELPEKVFENKIGDFYTSLTTDKRFILLENGKWDLRSRHTSDKIAPIIEDDEEELDEIKEDDTQSDENYDENYNIDEDTDEMEFNDNDDGLQDLVVYDDEEIEN